MIRHQTEAQGLDGNFAVGGGEQLAEGGVVAVLVKDDGPAVAAIAHMVGVSGHVSAWSTRHGVRTVRQAGRAMQEHRSLFSSVNEHLRALGVGKLSRQLDSQLSITPRSPSSY